jgi:PleD family two-component response regulator
MALLVPPVARVQPMGAEAATCLALAAGEVGLSRNVDTLERHTLEDTVACAGNGRHWEGHLHVEVERAIRSQMPLRVDLDPLKHMNDAHGHACGDRALALVGGVIRLMNEGRPKKVA